MEKTSMEKTNNTHEGWKRSVPEGMFLSTYRDYLANLDFITERQENRKRREENHRKQPATPRLLKTNDAAAYLGMSDWKLRSLVQSGEISYIAGDGTSPWLFDKQDLDRWIETRKQRL
jgi:excisionase family DNA binding protein